jgi:hypothetical protein
MGLNVFNVHGETYAAGTHHHSWLNFVVLDVGWHVGSPSQWKHSPLALDPKTTSQTDAVRHMRGGLFTDSYEVTNLVNN